MINTGATATCITISGVGYELTRSQSLTTLTQDRNKGVDAMQMSRTASSLRMTYGEDLESYTQAS